ncbi:transposase domain-containing protein [Methylobacterium mesophilicum SR1.6/6]|uniref:Transposase domain-containing protein n=1 Tax=Methylobacterium mesophilicum SR1.6/6 TaxID=908290 RepID=A0A6B9FL51_9HYPH|nr:transposase domain-containing protein [Methylobacterium mesophilicum SR1.6/6]
MAENCKIIGVGPQACLVNVITRIAEGYPQRRFDDLLPRGLQATPALKP